MRIPRRIRRYTGRHSLVDGIPFEMPVKSKNSPALMAIFTLDADRARGLLEGDEVHPLRLWGGRGLLVVTVVDYEITNIGRYVEFSVAIACTHGRRPAPPLLGGLFQRHYGTGQYVVDLPVSSEISVKGGKGIWGMPKHQANLDFVIGEETVSSQYDLDGQLALRIEVNRPRFANFPVAARAANYCAFRGMLMRSIIYFRGRGGVNRPFKQTARLVLGDHPRVAPLKELDVSPRPLISGFLPSTAGVLDDHIECWFLTFPEPPATVPEGMESVVGLGLSQAWLAPPDDPALLDAQPGSSA